MHASTSPSTTVAVVFPPFTKTDPSSTCNTKGRPQQFSLQKIKLAQHKYKKCFLLHWLPYTCTTDSVYITLLIAEQLLRYKKKLTESRSSEVLQLLLSPRTVANLPPLPMSSEVTTFLRMWKVRTSLRRSVSLRSLLMETFKSSARVWKAASVGTNMVRPADLSETPSMISAAAKALWKVLPLFLICEMGESQLERSTEQQNNISAINQC